MKEESQQTIKLLKNRNAGMSQSQTNIKLRKSLGLRRNSTISEEEGESARKTYRDEHHQLPSNMGSPIKKSGSNRPLLIPE